MFPRQKQPKKSIYLDYAATTPVGPQVEKTMRPFFGRDFGNPSSLYKRGVEARKAVEAARKTIASQINARPEEIIFTAGGTESCNLAIFGVARNNLVCFFPRPRKKADKAINKYHPHIITSAIEHHAVLNPVKALEGEGCEVTVLDVDSTGLINISNLQKAIRPETVLVSVMYANNEIGTIQPIGEIGRTLAKINIDRQKNGRRQIYFHTDACQAAGFLDLNVNRLGVDLMSVNGSKIYGPKQTGFLYVRTGTNLKPLIYGGGQERDLRSGTENVPGIVGLAKALELAQTLKNSEIKKLSRLRGYFIGKLMNIEGVELNGPNPVSLRGAASAIAKATKQSKLLEKKIASSAGGGLAMTPMRRLPNNISVTIRDVEGEALMLYLDSYGIEVSTGSACTTGLADPSHVLLALGRTPQEARSSIRMSMGRQTTKQQLDYVLKVLPGIVQALRKVTGSTLDGR